MLYINGKSEKEFSAKLKEGFSVSGMEVEEASYSHMRNRSTLLYHDTVLGLKKINITLDFSGRDEHEVILRKSLFDAEICGRSELILPDGFIYDAVCHSLGTEIYHGRTIAEASYELSGIRHGLSVTVGDNGTNYKVGTVTFPTVTAGEELQVDGVKKRILVDGVPAAQRAEWLEFPYLKPGMNQIICKDILTVEFYPAYF